MYLLSPIFWIPLRNYKKENVAKTVLEVYATVAN